MKIFSTLLISVLATIALSVAATSSFAGGSGGLKGESFIKIVYFSGSSTGSGASASDAFGVSATKNIFKVESGVVVQTVDVVVTAAVTGSSPQINIGDEDDSDGYVADANVTEATPGVYHGAGAYVTGGANKYYSGAKNLAYNPGGTVSAGSFVVVIKGYKL